MVGSVVFVGFIATEVCLDYIVTAFYCAFLRRRTTQRLLTLFLLKPALLVHWWVL